MTQLDWIGLICTAFFFGFLVGAAATAFFGIKANAERRDDEEE